MNEILKKKKDRKTQLEDDLPLLQKLIGIVKNNEIEIKELETEFKIPFNKIQEIFKRNSVTCGIYNDYMAQFRKNLPEKINELENEYEKLSKGIQENSLMEKYGREIIIGIVIAVVSFLLGKYIS